MPMQMINGAQLHYDVVGQGVETLVFIHGLMLASESWRAQVAAFRDRYRIVTFDLRGQGKSAYSGQHLDMDTLAVDVVELIKAIGGGPCHLVSFSMGTFIAMRVAARQPQLVRSLTLIGPSADAEEPENLPRYHRLIRWVTWLGPRLFTGPLLRILFGDTWLSDPSHADERNHWLRYLQRLPRSLARAAAASAGRLGIHAELAAIRAPTLVVSGSEDRPISPARARLVHQSIARSTFANFPLTGHAVMIERPDAFNARLKGFLDAVSSVPGMVAQR